MAQERKKLPRPLLRCRVCGRPPHSRNHPNDLCPHTVNGKRCKGTIGTAPGQTGAYIECLDCGGTGWSDRPCGACRGVGWV
jgi:hypothetical protein